MRLKIWFISIALGAVVFLDSGARAQTDLVGEVRTENGLHRAAFTVPQGVIRVNVPDDLSVGDSISGTVYTEPDKGKNQKDLEKNTSEIASYVVELTGQKTNSSERRFRWSVPITAAGGVIPILLRDPKGKLVGRGNLPVNPSPAGPAPSQIDLPSGAQAGSFASAWGPFAGPADTSVGVGGKSADIIAESPRKLVFQTPPDAAGQTVLDVRKGTLSASGSLFVLGVRGGPAKSPLRSGETTIITATVSGLNGLQQPASLVLVNHTPGTVTLDGGPVQQLVIQPAQVAADGTYTLSRTIRALTDGRFDISVAVSRAAAADLPLERLAGRTVDAWSMQQRVPISSEARSLIISGVRDAQPQLNRLFAPQLALRADRSTELDWLVRSYCFELRDRSLVRRLANKPYSPRTPMARAFVPQSSSGSLEAPDVRRYSFTQFLSQLLDRLTPSDPLGDLEVSSQPDRQPIVVDNVTFEALTNNNVVLSVGKHTVRVGSCTQSVIVNPNQRAAVRCPQ